MTTFLSSDWFSDVNLRLAEAEVSSLADVSPTIVVVEFPDAPSDGARALTLTLSPAGARVTPGDHLGADTVIRLPYEVAVAISTGASDAATALRQGRLKVRGDVNNLVVFAPWMAHLWGEAAS